MPLRIKALTLVFISVAVLIASVDFLFSRVLLDQMSALEREQMTQHAIRVEESLKSKVESIPVRLLDWAAWDDTYEFMETKDPAYIESNLVTTGIVGLESNFIIYFDSEKKPVLQKAIDFRMGQDIPMPAAITSTFSAESPLLSDIPIEESRSGILILDNKPLLFGMRPIVKSDKSGPARGTLLWARYLDSEEISEMSKGLRLNLSIRPVNKATSSLRDTWKSEGNKVPFAAPVSEVLIRAYAAVDDYFGKPALDLEVEAPREVYRRGLEADTLVMYWLLVAGLIFALIVVVSIERVVIRRIAYVAKSLKRIAREDDFDGRLTVTGKDEISMLAGEINETLEALAQGRHGMRVARDLAEMASANKSLFVSTMSHEIRTPLNGILGMTESLGRDTLSPEQKEKVQVLNDCAESLFSIVNDVLDFAKIEAGKIELELIDFQTAALIQRTINTVSERARQKGILLAKEIQADLPACLHGDPTRIGQVIINLLSNAVKFTNEGTVTLKIACETEGEGRSKIEFSVQDTGIGMTPLQKSRLFEAFSQADASIARRFGGTGLGLSISRKIVDLMAGTFSVESSVGQGSTFSFSISLPHGNSSSVAENVQIDITAGKPLNVVVVDDKESNRKVASLHIQSLGHSCIPLSSGDALLQLFNRSNGDDKNIDLVLLDIQMPLMSGPEAAKLLRESDFYGKKKVPIVALTAQASTDFNLDNSHSDVFDGWLMKPLRIQELAVTLRSYSDSAAASKDFPKSDAEKSKWPAVPGIDSSFLWEQYTDSSTILEMLACFHEESQQLCDEVSEGITGGDKSAIARALHAIRGSLVNTGAIELSREAKEMEERVKLDSFELTDEISCHFRKWLESVVTLRAEVEMVIAIAGPVSREQEPHPVIPSTSRNP